MSVALMHGSSSTVLLPLREKVACECAPDEGSRSPRNTSSAGRQPDRAFDPSSDPFGATFSRKGRRAQHRHRGRAFEPYFLKNSTSKSMATSSPTYFSIVVRPKSDR